MRIEENFWLQERKKAIKIFSGIWGRERGKERKSVGLEEGKPRYRRKKDKSESKS